MELNKIQKFALMFVLLVIAMYMTFLVNLQVHEEVHRQIFKHHGLDSKVTINYFRLSGYTSALNQTCSDECNLLNNQTEIVGYHVTGLIFTAWIIFFCWILVRNLK